MTRPRRIRLHVTISQRLVRDSLLYRLLLNDGIELVGESASGNDTLRQLEMTSPGVLIIEENLPDNDGLTIAETALNMLPSLSVLLICETPVSDQRLAIYLEAGIKAVVSKEQSVPSVIRTLFYIRNGQTYVDRPRARPEEEPEAIRAYQALSGREREVAHLMARRIPVRDIAQQLGVSCKTVHSYKDRIFVKLGFERLPELILFMIRHRNGDTP